MNWLLDTDVISQAAKRNGDPRVVAWLRAEKNHCYTSSVVIAQLAYWVRTKEGKRRDELQAWLTRFIAAMQGRILGFNVSVAHAWADQEDSPGKSRTNDAGRRRLHRRDSTEVWADHRDRKRKGLRPPRNQSLQPVQNGHLSGIA